MRRWVDLKPLKQKVMEFTQGNCYVKIKGYREVLHLLNSRRDGRVRRERIGKTRVLTLGECKERRGFR